MHCFEKNSFEQNFSLHFNYNNYDEINHKSITMFPRYPLERLYLADIYI